MRPSRIVVCFFLVAGCSQGAAPQSTGEMALTPATILQTLGRFSVGQKEAAAARLADTSLLSYYDDLSMRISPTPISIAGVVVNDLAAQLAASRAGIAALDAKFGTFGTLWRSLGLEPQLVSADSLATDLDHLAAFAARPASESTGLNLTIVPLSRAASPDCDNRSSMYYISDGITNVEIADALTKIQPDWELGNLSALSSVYLSYGADYLLNCFEVRKEEPSADKLTFWRNSDTWTQSVNPEPTGASVEMNRLGSAASQ